MNKSDKYWERRALERLTESEKISEDYIKSIKNIYDKSYRDISAEIERVYVNYSKDTGIDVQTLKTLLTKKQTNKVWQDLKKQGLDKYIKDNYKSRITRLEQIKAQIYAKAKEVYTQEELSQNRCYQDVIQNSYYRGLYDIAKGTNYNFAFSKIDSHLIDNVLSERWSGKNYSQRIWGNTDVLAQSVSEIVGSGLLNGKNIYKMSAEIKKRFDVSKFYAERLVRTECNHFHNEADCMAYAETGTEEYVYIATLDTRTSDICISLDHKKFKLADKKVGENFPPMHPNCRSTTRAFVSYEVEQNLKRRARNPVTGETELVGNINYKEWLEKIAVK